MTTQFWRRSLKDQLEIEAKKYEEKVIQEVKDGKRGSSYNALKKLGSLSESSSSSTFSIPSHIDENLTASQSAERLADHFSSISQTLELSSQNQKLSKKSFCW